MNIATRLNAGLGDNAMIAGFIVTGDAPKKIVARGVGPSLTSSDVSGVLADPVLDLRDANGVTILLNDNWRDNQRSQIEGTVYEPKNNLEPTIVATLQPGAYTAILTGKGNTTGVGLVEVYDASTLESRGRVDAGEGPTHIRAGPDNRFYVIDTRGEAVLIYGTEDEPEQVGSAPLPGEPYGVAIDLERGHLWVTLTAKNELVQLTLEEDTLRELARYPTVRQPNTVAVDPASGRVYVTGGADGELQILDPRSG